MKKSLFASQKVGRAELTKYLFLTYGLFILTVLCFAWGSFDSYLERKTLEMKSAAYEIEFNLTNTLDYTESVLNFINRKIVSTKGNKQQISKIFKAFKGSHGDYGSIKDSLSDGMFFWIDVNKFLSVSSKYGIIKIPLDVSKRDYLAYSQKTPWKIFTGAPTIGSSSGDYIIPAGVGVSDENSYIGTTAVGFKVRSLVDKFSKLVGVYKVDFAILDKNNKVLMESVSGMFSQNSNLARSLELPNKSLVGYREVVVSEFSLTDPRGFYIIERNFEKYPYKVLIGSQNGLITKSASSQIWPHLIELLIVTIFFLTILYFVRNLFKE